MVPSPRPRSPEAITRLLKQAEGGDTIQAFDALLPLVYDELKMLARGRLRGEREGHTLSATALVHEAYLRLVKQTAVSWQSRAHFYAVASEAMRRVLVDYARKRSADKRGGAGGQVSLEALDSGLIAVDEDRFAEVIALDDLLHRMDEQDARAAKIVQYRVFGGLRHNEIAEVLGVSEVTVRRSWSFAKLWLRRELSALGEGPATGKPA
ncbi:MAG: sigma-70 family RNA polymerase sigma factor [Gemmatimonadota bacterium]|nr:sigma-70 family RNA polymerase sigma factor [Gemmatimonadota bacterium]